MLRRSTLIKASLILALTLLAPSVWADEQTIAVPGEHWAIHIQAPKLEPGTGGVPSVFYGVSDRLQISFFVEPPRCPGGDSNENVYNCFAKTLRSSPFVKWDTERGNTVKNGILVTYLTQMTTPEGTGRAFNGNLLFVRNGKWADLHVSIASPTKDDVTAIYAILDSVTVEDQ